MKFAIIETGGKQYKVSSGQKLNISKIEGDGNISFDKVLLVASKDGKVEIGTPYLPSVKIEGRIVRQGRERKKIVFKYHSKARYRKKKGHRQEFTEVEFKN